MKKFDLEAAKNGAPVITENGSIGRVVCHDRMGDYPIIVLFKNADREDVGYYRDNGTSEHYADIFMAPVKKKGWVNIYPSNEPGVVAKPSLSIYEYKTYADSYATKDRIHCLEIEWPE